MTTSRLLKGSFFLFIAGVLTLCATSPKEFAVAINQAGRQRMLSQKMSKEFLLVVADIDAAANKGEMAKSEKLFDSSLNRLLQGDAEVSMPAPPSEEIKAQLTVVRGIWTPFKAALDKGIAERPDANALAFIAKESLHLVTEMDKAVTLYEKACQSAGIEGTGTVVNVAGRQRMLSQRMSKDILLLYLEVDTETARKDLAWAHDLFDKSLKGLTDGDETMKLPAATNKTVRQQLVSVSTVWSDFRSVVEPVIAQSGKPETAQIKPVAELSSKLLVECQKVVSALETEVH